MQDSCSKLVPNRVIAGKSVRNMEDVNASTHSGLRQIPRLPRVSVVIPTLDEAGTIVATLRRLGEQGADEVVVVDGGSRDGTVALARGVGVRVLSAPRGRGSQQNRGAAATTGDVLLFLHADCRLDPGAIAALRRFV